MTAAEQGIPASPKGLTPRSRRLWRAILDDYELSDAEQTVLENGLRMLDRAGEAAAIVSAEGLTVVDRYGGTRAHPMLDAEVRCRREFAAAVRQLGVKLVESMPAPRRKTSGPKPRVARLRQVNG
jgi:hypothetical protein